MLTPGAGDKPATFRLPGRCYTSERQRTRVSNANYLTEYPVLQEPLLLLPASILYDFCFFVSHHNKSNLFLSKIATNNIPYLGTYNYHVRKKCSLGTSFVSQK